MSAATFPTLPAALQAARAAARVRPLVRDTLGAPGNGDPEACWYYAATDEIMALAIEVMDAHGLELEWTAMSVAPGLAGMVTTQALLRHASGEQRAYSWHCPPMADAATPTHAILGAVRHAMRCLTLLILDVQMISTATADRRKRDKSAAKGRAEPPPYTPPRGLTADDCELAEWAGGGHPDPGPLPGEDLAAPAPLCSDELAALLSRWRAAGRDPAEGRRSAGVPERGRLDEQQLAALGAYLRSAVEAP